MGNELKENSQIIHELQSQSYVFSHIHIIGKSSASVLNHNGVPIQFVSQMDLNFSRFATGKGMFAGVGSFFTFRLNMEKR